MGEREEEEVLEGERVEVGVGLCVKDTLDERVEEGGGVGKEESVDEKVATGLPVIEGEGVVEKLPPNIDGVAEGEGVSVGNITEEVGESLGVAVGLEDAATDFEGMGVKVPSTPEEVGVAEMQG